MCQDPSRLITAEKTLDMCCTRRPLKIDGLFTGSARRRWRPVPDRLGGELDEQETQAAETR